MDTERQIAAAVQAPVMPQIPEEPEEKAPEIRMPELRMPVNDINTIDLQSELANSMREILSGIRPASSTDELESAPTLVQPAAAEAAAAEEEELPKHVSIDDILTGTAVQTDEQSAQPENVPPQQEKPAVRTVVDTAAGQQAGEGVQPVVRTVVETPVQLSLIHI